ncbi:hypothetical protein Taro_004308 [Colocasia esculenta]|uniref:Transmembrane protein n=1 Tax=Colocasia esculenta TaxID=4460 RepID=A0A843TR75_COLES|nr:hypothetical protein [Colocasia esculenta]
MEVTSVWLPRRSLTLKELRLEPVEGVLRATSVLELAANLADSGAEGKMSPLSHCLSLRWFRSHTVVLGMGPQLGQVAVVVVLWCFCGGFVSLFRGGGGRSQVGEQREWLVCPPLGCQWKWLGCCCLLLVVSASVSSWFRSPVLGCQSVVAPACVASRPRGVSGVWGGSACGPLTSWRSEVVVLVVRRPSQVVARWSLLTPLLSSVRGSSSRKLGVATRTSGSLARVREVGSLQLVSERSLRLPCKVRVRTTVGCSYCCVACRASVVARCVRVVVARLAVDSLAVVFSVWRTIVGKPRCDALGRLRGIWVCVPLWLREPACGVAFTGVGTVTLVYGCLSALCWLVVSSGEVLLEFFSVGFDGSFPEPFVVVLVRVSPRTVPCSFSQNCALVVLVEVLSGLACVVSALLLAAVFSLKCAVWLGCVLVRFSQDVSWSFWWSQGVVPLAVRLAAALASLSRCSFPSFSIALVGLYVSPWLRWFVLFSCARRALPDGGLLPLSLHEVAIFILAKRHFVGAGGTKASMLEN